MLAFAALAPAARADIPRPEHPRPDAFRPNWQSLNGQWEFEIDSRPDAGTLPIVPGKSLARTITVPFCPESKLSGVANTDLMKNVWYRRLFDRPDTMKNKRVLLHFGAVDYRARVWVNGQLAGTHTGGDVSFAFDITPLLQNTKNELVVQAFDDTASGNQPTGKQTHTVSQGGDYTRTTGIWQTVWLEAVGDVFVEQFSLVPDPDQSRVLISASLNGADTNLVLKAEAFAGGKLVGTSQTPASGRSNPMVLNLSRKTLWEPGKPFLYDLKFTLTKNNAPIDTMSSYFGLRKVSSQGRSILINDKRVFQRLILDQGFYPDGIWTAPTDADLKGDIERSMAAGYNGARLHQKVFEPRFLYWADKLGYLVWGEYTNSGFNWKPENYSNYINEWTEVLLRDRNHPAIIGWCAFNETPPAAIELQNVILHETRAIDPTRLVLETSGWTRGLAGGDARDDHDYTMEPERFREKWLNFFSDRSVLVLPARYGSGDLMKRDFGTPFMVSEFGGAGFDIKPGGFGWGTVPKTKEAFYTRYAGLLNALLDNPDMCGFCYTQLTDIEQEQNGLYYYDRTPKFDINRIAAITSRQAAYEKTGPVTPAPAPAARARDYHVLVGAAADTTARAPYRFTTDAPGADWFAPAFDDATWQAAPGPFGTRKEAQTRWQSREIWLRKTFDWDGNAFASGALVVSFDEDTDVYVNGEKVWSRSGFIDNYAIFDITAALKTALQKGQNTIAVHTRQTEGGQFIDLALLIEPQK